MNWEPSEEWHRRREENQLACARENDADRKRVLRFFMGVKLAIVFALGLYLWSQS